MSPQIPHIIDGDHMWLGKNLKLMILFWADSRVDGATP